MKLIALLLAILSILYFFGKDHIRYVGNHKEDDDDLN